MAVLRASLGEPCRRTHPRYAGARWLALVVRGSILNDRSGTTNVRESGVTDPASHGDERTTLMGFLQRQRDLVVWKLSGASDDALRSVGTPTGMTLHGIVRHLENVERSWFREVFAGESELEYDWTEDDPDGDFHVPSNVAMADLLAEYQEECARCDEVINAASLDEGSKHRNTSLRWIILHMTEETARHVGHIDILREQVDGMVGEDPWENSPS
jgi:uncharacterized damage-inducible protein DinB